MAILSALETRCESKCELCTSGEELTAFTVPPKSRDNPDHQVALCKICLDQVQDMNNLDANHMRCASESMWSQVPAVQALSYKILKSLATKDWAADAIAMIYMEDETREWAESGFDEAIVHKDSNGHTLQNGDSVTLIKDLNVKGGGFTAKRGTAVRRIRLDPDNANHIEGKVDGQHIVILTQYVKKS